MTIIRPIEESDPEFASLISWCVGRRAAYPRIEIEGGTVWRVYGRTREEMTETDFIVPGRNGPCFCGSGKKFKKCCEKA